MSGDGGLLRVDPAALSGAGSAVAGLSEVLTAAVGSLTGSYNADTGQDAAGTAFGFAYQDSARALVDGVSKGVNALRHIGYLIQGSATNYSCAEAAADIRGGATPLPAPAAPAQYSAPGGDPDVNGPGQAPPVLWYLVESLVGDWWPNGSPGELRAAGAAWSVFATPLYGVAGQIAGPCGVIDAQQMPDREPMKKAVLDAGSAMSSLAGEAQKRAGELSGFATDIETTQNAIRDLLDKLSSVVGSIVDQGVLGTVFELLTGDAEEKIHEVANDIKAVIANHKRQSAARKELLADLVNGIKNYSHAMEIVTRVELVNYLGEDAGRIAANVFDAFTDANVGVALGGINTVGSIASIDPIGDPKGTWEMIKGLNKMAEILNPMTAPMAFATDPQGSLDMVKDLTHYDDITSDRPFLGIGELGFDIGTAIIPGGAGVKAAGGARAAEGAAARAEISATERAAGEAGGIASATGGLRGVSRDLEGVTAKLDDLNRTGLDGGKPPSGSPGPLPKPGEPGPPVARDTVPSGGKPTSAPVSGEPVSPPVTHIPDAALSPKADAPSASAGSETTVPASAPSYEVKGAVEPAPASATASGAPDAASGHASEGLSSAAGGAGDSVPAAVGAHGAEGVADSAGHGPHPVTGDGAGGSHGGSGDHGAGGHADDPGSSPNDGPSNKSDDHHDGGVSTGDGASHDPVHSYPEPRGDGWERVDDKPNDKPTYGEPLDEHWSSDHYPQPDEMDPKVRSLITDYDAPYGRDAHGVPMSKADYEARYNEVGPEGREFQNYPPNDGAVSHSKVVYNSVDAYIRDYGSGVDRIGLESGKYLAVMRDGVAESFEARGLPISTLVDPYFSYSLTGRLPEHAHRSVRGGTRVWTRGRVTTGANLR
ncbi:WXG100 family type VII secretion target [Mycolicibacterium vinylchloridicum]|uniref:WXG100 family type VII secretion target n=1 Tax=Mycolicibacterium vinylchloridicum TaxID=2736928 RepID=UPI0015C8C3E5|nr:hypothetical protein [Mycolicibacterium vinylchloridicum]